MGCPEQRVHMAVLAVVELAGRFLIIREARHGQRWYLPAGGVEVGESYLEAARRETLEEAGVLVEPWRVIAVEHVPAPLPRLRFVVAARPLTFEPKRVPDGHSLEARWASVEEIAALPLRHREVLEHIAAHGAAR